MQERYRRDYPGEFVISNTTWKDGKKSQNREWIENPIKVIQTSGRATCIAKSKRYEDTFYRRVAENRGDLLARNKMQTYGVEEVWEVMNPNFLVSQVSDNLAAMIESGYPEDVIVYTSAANCIKFPGQFYLIPYSFTATQYAQAAWLACFDEHKEIYLVGYDEFIEEGKRNQKMIDSVSNVMDAYRGVQFIHILDGNSPDEWRRRLNFKTMTVRDYISHCDI